MPVITVEMDEHDFEMLTVNSTHWADHGMVQHIDCYVAMTRGEPVSTAWRMIYWVDTWADVLLARAYLGSIGEPFQVVSDESDVEPDPGFAFLTDYQTTGWRNWPHPPATTN